MLFREKQIKEFLNVICWKIYILPYSTQQYIPIMMFEEMVSISGKYAMLFLSQMDVYNVQSKRRKEEVK